MTGICLLFWGAMTGHPLLGLGAALAVEARSWVSTRWEFSPSTYVRAWHYSILCGLLIAVLAWMNGMKPGRLHTLFVWAPLVLLPVELAMRFGKAKTIPFNTFSFFARRKMQSDLKQGRQVHPKMLHTGMPYLAVVLLATAMSSRDHLQHWIGINLIVGAILIIQGRKNGTRLRASVVGLGLALTLSLATQWGLFTLYDHYRGGGEPAPHGSSISANESRTSIGRLGRLKLSPRIFWRMQVNQGNVPHLLRVATYNHYQAASWRYQTAPLDDEQLETSQRDAKGYLGEERLEEFDIRIFRENDETPPDPFPATPDLRIIGEIDARITENPIPFPDSGEAVGGVNQLGPDAFLDCNTLGTVRLANPDFNVIEYQIWRGQKWPTESAPYPPFDLAIPVQEKEIIRQVSQSLQLKQLKTTQQKIRRIREYFISQFHYSTHLTTPPPASRQRQTAVGTFLVSSRRGHCEYFATAAALLLREAGVPTRYCVGFSANELDSGREEWLLRGTHAHAWCRVWIPASDNTPAHWQDFDPTPPGWLDADSQGYSDWRQTISDWWQRLIEDFQIWRTHASNRQLVNRIVTLLISLLTLWIIRKLWKSRQSGGKNHPTSYTAPRGSALTPLNQLESRLSKILGPRPTGTPLSRWVLELAHHAPELKTRIQTLCQLHNIARFDPNGASEQQLSQLKSECHQLRRALPTIQAGTTDTSER